MQAGPLADPEFYRRGANIYIVSKGVISKIYIKNWKNIGKVFGIFQTLGVAVPKHIPRSSTG